MVILERLYIARALSKRPIKVRSLYMHMWPSIVNGLPMLQDLISLDCLKSQQHRTDNLPEEGSVGSLVFLGL